MQELREAVLSALSTMLPEQQQMYTCQRETAALISHALVTMSAELLVGQAGASAEGILTSATALLVDARTPLEVYDVPTTRMLVTVTIYQVYCRLNIKESDVNILVRSSMLR